MRGHLQRMHVLLVAMMTVAMIGSGLFASAPFAAATTPAGSVLWSHRYNGPGNAEDEGQAVAVSPDGSITYMAGTSVGTDPGQFADYFTGAYDTVTGSRLWARRYDGSAAHDDQVEAMVVSPDGSAVYVTGRSQSASFGWSIATVAYDAATGARLWATRTKDAEGHAIGVSPDGTTVFVAGMTQGRASFVTVAYDAATGVADWTKVFALPLAVESEAYGLSVSPDGSAVTVVGDSADSTYEPDYATIRYDAADGSVEWFRRFDGRAHLTDIGETIGSTPDGSEVLVSGISQPRRSPMNLVTLAYDPATGATLWKRSRGGPSSLDTGRVSLAIAPDGSKVFVATPVVGPSTSNDYGTVAYDATTGASMWFRRFDSAGYEDLPFAIAVSSTGQVAVTGLVNRVATQGDYATLVYDGATGANVWSKRFSSSGYNYDQANALAFTPDGSELIVTGYSQGATSSYDIETLAYSAG